MTDDIRFACQHCGQSLEAPPDMAGESIDCPTCQKSITVPIVKPTHARSQYSPPEAARAQQLPAERPQGLPAENNTDNTESGKGLWGYIESLDARLQLVRKEIKRLEKAEKDVPIELENEEGDLENRLEEIKDDLQEVVSTYRDEAFSGTGMGYYFGRDGNGIWTPYTKKPTKAQVGRAIQAVSETVGADAMVAALHTVDFDVEYADQVLTALQELFPDLRKETFRQPGAKVGCLGILLALAAGGLTIMVAVVAAM